MKHRSDCVGVLSFVFIHFIALLAMAAPKAGAAKPDLAWAEKRLLKAGLSKSFVKDLKLHYDGREFGEILNLNVLLYLKKGDYHGPQVNDESLRAVQKFMVKHRKDLARTRKHTGVPESVVASLLWIESRHGDNQGRYHVASVYVSLLHGELDRIQRNLQKKAYRYRKDLSPAQLKEVRDRAKKKAAWALTELKAIEKIYKRDRQLALRLRGSFSGAIGMPQFLPSSYNKWAKSFSKKAPDLTAPGDAILSVGNYLKAHGWNPKNKRTHEVALFRYNNSRDYANAILKLANSTSTRPGSTLQKSRLSGR